MKNIFEQNNTVDILNRINKLLPTSKPIWGKMAVAQMLAHCNVTYELVYDNKHPKPSSFVRFFLKLAVKNTVVNDKHYKRNGQTAPAFLIKENKDFETERNRLNNYIKHTQELGATYFDNKESHSFGKLTIGQWSNMFYKHLDHHLTQFGV